MAAEDTAVTVAEVKRRHTERYRQRLLERPAARRGPQHRHTVRDRLSKLRGLFRRLDERDAADRPPRQLVFDSDFPIADELPPRFLYDAAATTLLDEWLLHRPDCLRSNLLFTDHGSPVNASRMQAAVRKAAPQGVSAGSPHTNSAIPLADQAINRGIPLEVIASLLGHKSLSMTRVYARLPTGPSPTSTSPFLRMPRHSTTSRANYRPTSKRWRWPSSRGRCTAECSATATALAPSRWTATSSRSSP
ncbi:tyrosine-type recombinase/integrase [Streptomyces sp. NPDC051243]|uniref:tyrosine-type recombinase/integrase n=1 Tax=Streptomyces sp. NPDC051243 TaxID=3365646 RepID=UPI0037924370